MASELRHRLRKLEARMPEQLPAPRPSQALERIVALVAAAQARGEVADAQPEREMECPFPPGSARARLWDLLERRRRAELQEQTP